MIKMIIIKRILKGSGVSLLIGLAVYTSFKVTGIDMGGEQSLLVLFPSAIGFLSSFIIF